MSVTAAVWLCLYCISIVGAFSNPVLGAMGYFLEYYMRPELKWWGKDLPALRYNLIVSLALGVAYLVKRKDLRKMIEVPNRPLKWLIGLAGIMAVVTVVFAVNVEISYNWATQWAKMALVFPLLLVAVVRTRSQFDAVVGTNMLGALWWGWQAYTDPKREQSRLLNIGSGDTLNDNEASAHLLTILPFIMIYAATHKDKRFRIAALIALPLVINTIILCNSRGATMGLLAAVAASAVLIRSGYRLRVVGAVAVLSVAFLGLADPQFIARQQTTTNYEDDGSAQGRIVSWQGAYRLMLDRPFGAGGRGFHLLSPVYIPEVVDAHGGALRAPHNTWALVVSEWGILGEICHVAFYLSVFFVLRRIKKADVGDRFFYWRAFAMQLGLIAYLVASTFTDRLYAEAGYWIFGFCSALYRVQLTDQAEQSVSPPAEATGVAAA